MYEAYTLYVQLHQWNLRPEGFGINDLRLLGGPSFAGGHDPGSLGVVVLVSVAPGILHDEFSNISSSVHNPHIHMYSYMYQLLYAYLYMIPGTST